MTLIDINNGVKTGMLRIEMTCDDARKLLQIMIFSSLNAQNWLEVFHEIRRMTPSLVKGHLELSSQRLRIAAAIKDALDRDKRSRHATCQG